MDIAVIGAGNVGGALGVRWAALGHNVTYGLLSPDDAKHERLWSAGARLATPATAVSDAEVVVLAVPWPAAVAAVRSVGDLGAKTVIDCTNPVQFSAIGVEMLPIDGPSAAEIIADAAQNGRIVKTLNQVSAQIMADPKRSAFPALMYVAGDHSDAKTAALGLVQDLGFDARDAGPLRNARALEGLALLYMHQAIHGPLGRNFVHTITKWTP